MKILPVEAEFFCVEGWTDGQMDGQADITKLIIVFRNLRTRIKKGKRERNTSIKGINEISSC
jgi:hypothetical protein